MNSGSTDASPEIRLRSAIPGREGWEADVLRRRPQLARRIEESLRGDPVFSEVVANPMTGRILVTFEPESFPDGSGAVIQRAVDEEWQKLGATETTAALASRNPIFRVME